MSSGSPTASCARAQADPVGTSSAQSGIGGLDLRAKVNLWGNDTFEKPGATALALLPFITLPTDRHNGISPEFVEGGVIVPFAIKLSDKFGLGLNAGVTWLKDDDATGYHAEYLTSASLSYEWSDKLGTYYEVAAPLPHRGPARRHRRSRHRLHLQAQPRTSSSTPA